MRPIPCCDRHQPILTCEQLSLGYDNRPVMTDLSFQIFSGDYLSIIGENGAGKSTLMKTLLGLMKPLSGKVTVNCQRGRNCIGYLPQQTQVSRDFPATVWEVVLTGLIGRGGWHPFFTKKEKAAAMDNLERLHIADLKNVSFRNLSGGQQQRVLLARALCAAHEILMLDEPVTGLDAVASAELYGALAELNRKDGMTVVVVSHDIHNTILQSSRILHLGKSGYFFGTPAQYMVSEEAKMFFPSEENE